MTFQLLPKGALKALIATLVGTVFFLAFGYNMKVTADNQSFESALAAVEKLSIKHERLDVTNELKSFFPNGLAVEAAQALLERNGFTIYPPQKFHLNVVGSKIIRKSVLGSVEIRLVLGQRSQMIDSFSATLFIHTL